MSITIVMYHYVRDLARSRYPGIKGLTIEEFRGQLTYMKGHYSFVTARDAIAALRDGGRDLPPNAAMLTFDDGYLDHFQTVFPILHEAGIEGQFFPPAQPVLEGRLLDVNKIHFVLATAPDAAELGRAIEAAVLGAKAEFGLDTPDAYRRRHAMPSRYDDAEIMYVKRMLQKGLPLALRNRIADDLFRRHVSVDEAAFAQELYASVDQLRMMVRCGMYVGSHGYRHAWLNELSPDAQRDEVARSLTFLESLGAPTSDWVMCYPYGACDDGLIGILRGMGCALGLTTEVGIVPSRGADPMRLPRLNTNDLPKRDDHPRHDWTAKALVA